MKKYLIVGMRLAALHDGKCEWMNTLVMSRCYAKKINSMAIDFVASINRHLLLNLKTMSSSNTIVVNKLTLNTDDKFECIKLGDLIHIF